MVRYESEVVRVSFKLIKASIKEEEIALLDDIINRRASDGWELVTYAFMGSGGDGGRGVLITFRKD